MFNRIISLIGKDNFDKLQKAKVLVIGAGGVGGYAIENLVRSGISKLGIIDYDIVDISNINRQIIATNEVIGKKKTILWKDRALMINPNIDIRAIDMKVTSSNIDSVFLEEYDYIIDACDTVIVKKLLIKKCKEKGINLITVCGMGKKLNPLLVEIGDIRDTSYDPIAKALRKYVKDEQIKGKVMCIFSKEKIMPCDNNTVSSMMSVPSVAGILASSYVINHIIENKRNIN